MARYRSRSRSYSPRRRSRTPPRGRSRYYDDEVSRDRHRGGRRRSPAPSGLLVRNLPLDSRPEDLRVPFEKYGPVKDVYLPKNYYTGEPRGFGFVKFRYAEDAAEAKQRMDHKVIGGREIRIVFAEENRRTPSEMRMASRISDRYGGSNRGRSPPRSTRRRHYSDSRSPSPARDHGVTYDYHSPARSRSTSQSRFPGRSATISRSRSPQAEKEKRSRTARDERDYGPHSPQDDRGGKLSHMYPSPRQNGSDNGIAYASGRSNNSRGNSQSPPRSR